MCVWLDILSAGQNGRHFANDVFTSIFSAENCSFLFVSYLTDIRFERMNWHQPIICAANGWVPNRYQAINSLRPSDAIWRQWSWTTLAQVMACCLTAPSHYLNQCWLIIRGVLWHTSESSFAGIAQGIDSGYEFEKDILKNIFKSPRGQWVNWTNNDLVCLRMYASSDCDELTLQAIIYAVKRRVSAQNSYKIWQTKIFKLFLGITWHISNQISLLSRFYCSCIIKWRRMVLINTY